MTTHECPTCHIEHEPDTITSSIVALLALARAADRANVPIRSVGVTPGYITVAPETEDGLRALASLYGLPEPNQGGRFMTTQGAYAKAHVTIVSHAGEIAS